MTNVFAVVLMLQSGYGGTASTPTPYAFFQTVEICEAFKAGLLNEFASLRAACFRVPTGMRLK